MNLLLHLLARALEPREREFVLGDLAESAQSGWSAVWDIAGLIARRQLQIWTNWRPWVALIGVAMISGFCERLLLASMSRRIWEQWRSWSHYGVHYDTGVTSFGSEVAYLGVLAGATICWSAVNSSLLTRLSGRAAWLTGLLFYLSTIDSGIVYVWLSGNTNGGLHGPWWSWLFPFNVLPSLLVLILFVIPAIIGARRRVPGLIPATVLLTIAAAWTGDIRAHDLEIYSSGAFPAPSWFVILSPYVLVSWPALLQLTRLRLDASSANNVV